jgi:hypothetical protein
MYSDTDLRSGDAVERTAIVTATAAATAAAATTPSTRVQRFTG